MFKSYLRITSIDYPETSRVQCIVFMRKHPNFVTCYRFFKRTKNRKESEKIGKYADKWTNQFWLKKVTLPVFSLNNFCQPFFNKFFELLICKINVLNNFR